MEFFMENGKRWKVANILSNSVWPLRRTNGTTILRWASCSRSSLLVVHHRVLFIQTNWGRHGGTTRHIASPFSDHHQSGPGIFYARIQRKGSGRGASIGDIMARSRLMCSSKVTGNMPWIADDRREWALRAEKNRAFQSLMKVLDIWTVWCA